MSRDAPRGAQDALGLSRSDSPATDPRVQKPEEPEGFWKWAFKKRRAHWSDGVVGGVLAAVLFYIEDDYPHLFDYWTGTALIVAVTVVWGLVRREVQMRWRRRAKERMTAAERMRAYETERLTATEPPG